MIHNLHVPLTILTDAECLSKVIVKSAIYTDKCSDIERNETRETFDNHYFASIELIRSNFSIVDGLNKLTYCHFLESLLDIGKIDVLTE